jgi:leucyl-tRNA synthetase
LCPIEGFNIPKAIISIAEAIDILSDKISKEDYGVLLKLISPFCPHIAEELWEKIGGKGFVSLADWPKADEKKIDERFEQAEKALDKTVQIRRCSWKS